VTQTNAATAEESASASEELSAQAATLRELVAELQKLVTGSQSSHSSDGHQILHSRPYKAPAHRTAKNTTFRPAQPAIGGSRPALSSSPKKKDPESEIPLEDGFKDF